MGNRPHRWPGMPADGDPECIAWKCAACGEWVDDSLVPADDCSVDWRHLAGHVHAGVVNDGDQRGTAE